MESESGEFPGRKQDGKGSAVWKRRRDATSSLSSWSDDAHLLVNEKASQTSGTAISVSPSSSLSSYFSCRECFADTEKREPIITFCGHVFCWPCLYKSISAGIGRLRGACPACESAVDLCPRTKTVCPIYYLNEPQTFPSNYLATHDKLSEVQLDRESCNIDIKNKSKGSTVRQSKGENKSEDNSGSEIMMERVADITKKVNPRKRPSDKRPRLYSSFLSCSTEDASAIIQNLDGSFHSLLRDWKSTIEESNNIIKDMQSCCKELSLQLVNEQEQGVQSISSSLHASFSSSPPASLYTSFYHFYCNYCHDDATVKEPIITVCGHVFCKHCFYDTILLSGFLECPLCRSAIDASSACPISGNGDTCEDQNREIREKWQEGVLLLNPGALELQMHSLIGDLNHEIAIRTQSICNNILRVQCSVDKFWLDLLKNISNPYNYVSNIIGKVEDFMKENADQELRKMSNIKDASMSARTSQVVQNELSSTPTCSGPYFSCGCCHKGTLCDPVVTYCTHLFCWRCLYLHIQSTGVFDEDGSLCGPCPICNSNNTVSSPSNAKLTVIPVCNAPNPISQEYQKVEDEEDNMKRFPFPPCPVAKSISNRQLNNMRNIAAKMMCKIKSLMDTLRSKMDDSDRRLYHYNFMVKCQRHSLLLGLLDGWSWAYSGPREACVIATDEADRRLSGLSRHWADIVDVDAACTLKE